MQSSAHVIPTRFAKELEELDTRSEKSFAHSGDAIIRSTTCENLSFAPDGDGDAHDGQWVRLAGYSLGTCARVSRDAASAWSTHGVTHVAIDNVFAPGGMASHEIVGALAGSADASDQDGARDVRIGR